MPPAERRQSSAGGALTQLVQAQLDEHQQRVGHDIQTLYVGYSGGLDSTALLLAAVQVAEQCQIETVALHARHGLQEDDHQWQVHCEEVCAGLGVQCVAGQLELAPGNVEAQARRARYDFFAAHLPADGLLLLAHHGQDQTETVLQRLFSGRGLLPMRTWGRCGAGYFARPLLSLSRDELSDFVTSASVAWIEDPSNAETDWDRNFLRHKVIPHLQARWPGLHTHVARVATAANYDHKVLGDTLVRAVTDVTGATGATGAARSRFPDNFISWDLAPDNVQELAVWLRALTVSWYGVACTDRAIDDFVRALAADTGAAVLRLDEDRELRLHGNALFLLAQTDVQPYATAVEPDTTLSWPYGDLTVRIADADDELAFAYRPGLTLRPRQGGEVMPDTAPWSSVKECLRQARVTPWLRRQYPLVYRQEQLICIPGIWVAEGQVDAAETGVVVSWAQGR